MNMRLSVNVCVRVCVFVRGASEVGVYAGHVAFVVSVCECVYVWYV